MSGELELGDLFKVLPNLTHPVILWLCCHMFRLSLILRSSDQVRNLWPYHSIITVEFSKSSHIVQYYQQNQRSSIQISFPLSVVNSTSGYRLEPVWLLAHCQLKGHPLLQSFVSLLSSLFSCSLFQRAAPLHPSSCAHPNTQEASEIHSTGRNCGVNLFPQMS